MIFCCKFSPKPSLARISGRQRGNTGLYWLSAAFAKKRIGTLRCLPPVKSLSLAVYSGKYRLLKKPKKILSDSKSGYICCS